ncbi:hypothetical protein Psyc_0995 [Psychrobacter arcticus 273-4]|uniref:Uncharacterized protein n=1 Tax=Psychrobacter arcticus (strain DSM 17307 / VKM B-2377 / 273-4) TaxID=259536 RepID=Q4FT10_PSYA2|nr:hypothetical protein [Psychrobacter arcticus]AAZ18848.1 hypothetical protein Psyc_0995 [Psychrobacter arcticus 273-4]
MNNLLANRFATSARLAINDMEWLKQGLGVKTVKFDIGAGGLPPEVNWEDKSAAIALIKSKTGKALASLLVWGDNELYDWSESFNDVVNHLAANMIKYCVEDDRGAPKSKYTLNELAYKMARMTLHFELYNLWSLYSVEGRLLFSGIDMSASTYSQIWSKYQEKMLHDIDYLMGFINQDVDNYRFKLKEV